MSIQLQEIKNIFIKNRLTEGVDFVRKEWLKGDGRAYIDTKVTDLSISDYIKTIFDDSGNIGVKIRTWGREKNRVVVGNNKSTTSITVWGASSSFVYSNSGVYLYDMYFDLLNNKVIINNQTYNLSLHHGNGASFLLFAIRNSSNAVDYKNLAKYKSFEVHNQINLVPCQLLHAIPATLDANNRARSAGECGMYDSISGKFFGNVANSGTFTVEGEVTPETHTGLQQIYQNKLIEGVDYEVHQWLYTELPERNHFMTLPIGSDTFSFNRVFYKTNSVCFFSTNGYIYYSSQQRIRLWDINSNRMLLNSSQYQYGELIQVISDSNSDSVTIKDSSIPKYAYDDLDSITVDFYEVYTDGNFASKFKTSKITVDGVERYIPCRLLRSIPRNLDAQCKERVAGECGMIDLISGKFYGNVANSGTFTVENDTENNE